MCFQTMHKQNNFFFSDAVYAVINIIKYAYSKTKRVKGFFILKEKAGVAG